MKAWACWNDCNCKTMNDFVILRSSNFVIFNHTITKSRNLKFGVVHSFVGRRPRHYLNGWDEVNMKRILLLVALFTSVPSVIAQDWARAKVEKSPRHREWVRVKHDGRPVETLGL